MKHTLDLIEIKIRKAAAMAFNAAMCSIPSWMNDEQFVSFLEYLKSHVDRAYKEATAEHETE